MLSVVRLLDRQGMYYPRTYALGSVEIRNPRADTPTERTALSESTHAFHEPAPEDRMRIVSVVDAHSEGEADRVATDRFREALDILSAEGPFTARPALGSAGAFRRLRSGETSPRLPSTRRGMSFKAFHESYPQWDASQFLLARDKNDLTKRLSRSFHWARRAHLEPDGQLRVLFRWFAMETIWTLGKDDDISPRVMWALGYPNGPAAGVLSADFTRRLGAHPTYAAWKPQIEKYVTGIRLLRNNTVHAGFRPQEVDPVELRELEHIASTACARVQSIARDGLHAGLKTAEELFEYLPILVEQDSLYIDDIHGTVVFLLENPLPGRWGAREDAR